MTSKATKSILIVVIAVLVVVLTKTTLFQSVVLTQLQLGQHHCYFTQSQFSLSWQHSVEKQPWLENYERRSKDFLLLDTQFKAFGAGTPNQGSLLSAPAGYVRFAVMQPLSELNWVISRNVQSTLLIDTQAIALYQWDADYETAIFQVQQWPWWKTVLKDSCDDYALKLQ